MYIMSSGTAFLWNLLVIIIGLLIAIVCLGAGLLADPADSALRQTVAALWVIQGILGLLIAAVGVFGATYFLVKEPHLSTEYQASPQILDTKHDEYETIVKIDPEDVKFTNAISELTTKSTAILEAAKGQNYEVKIRDDTVLLSRRGTLSHIFRCNRDISIFGMSQK